MLKPVSHHLPNDLPHSVSYSVSHRQLQRTQPALNILQDVALQKTRVHECCGQARVFFAMLVAAEVEGPVFWIAPKWQRDHLNPDGMRPYVKPQNFIFINPDRPEDTLWVMEEALALWRRSLGGGRSAHPTQPNRSATAASGRRK